VQLVRQYSCKTGWIVMLRVLPPTKKRCSFICCKTGSNLGGKTCNISIQPVLQQYCKKSSTFFVSRFSSFSSVKSTRRRQCYHWCITVVNFIYVTESSIRISCFFFFWNNMIFLLWFFTQSKKRLRDHLSRLIWISCWTFIPSSNVRVDTSSLDILIPLSVTLDT